VLVFDGGGLSATTPPQRHPSAPKMSNSMLIFSAGGPSTSPRHLSTTHQHRKQATTCSFSVLVGPEPHHATSAPPTIIENMLVFGGGGLSTSSPHLSTHHHRKRAYYSSFLMAAGSAPHTQSTTSPHQHTLVRFHW